MEDILLVFWKGNELGNKNNSNVSEKFSKFNESELRCKF